jgi:hypothetical protein
VITAKSELEHAVSTFSEAEAEWAIALLAPLLRPYEDPPTPEELADLAAKAGGSPKPDAVKEAQP